MHSSGDTVACHLCCSSCQLSLFRDVQLELPICTASPRELPAQVERGIRTITTITQDMLQQLHVLFPTSSSTALEKRDNDTQESSVLRVTIVRHWRLDAGDHLGL